MDVDSLQASLQLESAQKSESIFVLKTLAEKEMKFVILCELAKNV